MGMINLFNSRFQYNEYILLITDMEDFSQISNTIERAIHKEKTILLVAEDLQMARELHQQFTPTYVVFCIENIKDNQKTLEYFAKVKTIERYLSFSKEDGETVLKLIKHRMDEFLFFPIDVERLSRKIVKYRLSEVDKSIALLSSLEIEDLTIFLAKFYCDEFPLILETRERVRIDFDLFVETKKVIINSICAKFMNQHYNNKKEFGEIVNKLMQSYFINDPYQRINILKQFALDMLDSFSIDKSEDIVAIIYSEVMSRILYKYKKTSWAIQFINSAKVLCEIDIRFIALTLKYEIQARTQYATRSLHESVIYVLMNNTSHHLQKHISHISINCTHLKRLRTVLTSDMQETDINEKIGILHSIIAKDSFSFPLENLQSFVKQMVGLFRNFKDEVSDLLTASSIEYLLAFMGDGYSNYAGGLSFKIINNLSQNKLFVVNENIVIAAIYSLIENAYEAHAKTVTIRLEQNEIALLIIVSNDGKEIDKEIAQLMFKKHFSSKDKKEKGHKGLGLSVAKAMIESMNSSFYFNDTTNEFVLQINQFYKGQK